MEDILILSEDGKTLFGVRDKNVTKVVVPDGVENIEDNAFLLCESLSRIYISDSVRIIGNAFGGCSSLIKIDVALGNSNYTSINGILFSKDLSCLVRIPEGANLVKYSIPNTVKDIEKAAFDSCSFLKNVDIPSSVKSIGEYAFDCCSSLECIDIPDSVTSIGGHAFIRCSSLQSIDIPNSVVSIGEGAFAFCSSLKSLDVPKSLTNFDYLFLQGCSSLKDVEISDSVTSISAHAFDFCSSLNSINVSPYNPNFVSVEGVLLSKDMGNIIRMPEGMNLKEYKIPTSVLSIVPAAFYSCVFLESIEIPNNVAFIGSNAFEKCTSLRSIRFLHTEIEKCNIAENAFEGVNFDICTLYIPSGTRWAYRHHPVFSKFKNIVTDRQE